MVSHVIRMAVLAGCLALGGQGAFAQGTTPSPNVPTPSTPGPNPGAAATDAVTSQTKPPGEIDPPVGTPSSGSAGSTTAPAQPAAPSPAPTR